jgi:hypothetical protein
MHVFILNDLYQTEDKRSTRQHLLLQDYKGAHFETCVRHTGVLGIFSVWQKFHHTENKHALNIKILVLYPLAKLMYCNLRNVT